MRHNYQFARPARHRLDRPAAHGKPTSDARDRLSEWGDQNGLVRREPDDPADVPDQGFQRRAKLIFRFARRRRIPASLHGPAWPLLAALARATNQQIIAPCLSSSFSHSLTLPSRPFPP